MGFSSTIPVACSPFPLFSSSSRSSLPVFFTTCISTPSLQTKPLILPAIKPLITSSRKTGSRSRYFIRALPSAVMGSKSVKGGGELLVFENEEGLSVSLAEYTAGLSEKFAKERGAFTVVLSGGSLVKALRKLVESPYFESVDWGKWHVFWVDERVVPKDHEDSNYKLAYDGFLSKVPIPPGQVYAINDALSAEGAAEDYDTCLRHLVKTGVLDFNPVDEVPKFDLMLLGMGPDGHVASLFPGHPLINEKQKWVTCIKDSPKPPSERITFTFPVINASANVALVVTGGGKANAACRALQSNAIDGSDLLPVQMVSLKVGKLTWFTDKDATSKL